MKKTLLLASLISVSLMAGSMPVVAAPATYTVDGNVPNLCSVQLPRLLNNTPQVNVNSVTGQTLGIVQLTDSQTLAAKAASFDVGFAAWCNYAHRLVVESQNDGLWQDQLTPAPSGFANAVPYTAQIVWGGNSTNFRADAVTRQISNVSMPVNQPTAGDIELRVQVQAGASNANLNSPLLAGTYRDIIRVTVQPQ
jgi:hypothetical protein